MGKSISAWKLKGVGLRIIDDSDEDYLYSATKPESLDFSITPGKWVAIEDDEHNTLKRAISGEWFPLSNSKELLINCLAR